MEKMAETELSVCTATLDLGIQDFLTTTDDAYKFHSKKYHHCTVNILATVSPNGADEDWLSVRVLIVIDPYRRNLGLYDFKWAVSIIDIEGRIRYTRYFDNSSQPLVSGYGIENHSKNMSLPRFYEDPSYDDRMAKAIYIKKSFIRNRADEFLSSGALSLRCDIYFDFDPIKDFVCNYNPMKLSDQCNIFMLSIPYAVCHEKSDETGHSSDYYTVYDLTGQVLALPQFHELRKRFGVYGMSPVLASPCLERKEDITDVLEHVWIFDTRPDRFLLSLAQNPDSVGHKLVNASPVIRQCVKAPMKEQRDKRVEFPYVSSLTFFMVLHFLKTGHVFNYSDNILEVYKFSHLYEMENLQQKCAEFITWDSKTETEVEESEKIAELFSDDYLFRLLQSRKREIFGYISDAFVKDDRPNFDFYN